MSQESFLQSIDDQSVGTLAEVLKAISKKFPGSEIEGNRTIAVRIEGEHVADVFVHSPSDYGDDEEGADLSDAPVSWFNILGDEDMVISEFLIEKYGVEEMES